jgi:hypothetical protein
MSALRPLVLVSAILGNAFAQRVGAPTDDLDKLSVDELFTLQVTSVGRKPQHDQCIAEGMDAVITKPVNVASLLRSIGTTLRCGSPVVA